MATKKADACDKTINRFSSIEERRHAILEAAAEVFIEKGYPQASLGEIIARSKGSLSTLYSQFGNKEGLLRAVIIDTCRWPGEQEDELSPELTLEETLYELGIRFAKTVLTKRMVSVYRIVVTENDLTPDLAKFFFETGPKRVKKRIVKEFKKILAHRRIDMQAEDLAEVFIGALIGDLHFMYTLGIAPPTQQRIEAHVRTTVQLFCRGLSISKTEKK